VIVDGMLKIDSKITNSKSIQIDVRINKMESLRTDSLYLITSDSKKSGRYFNVKINPSRNFFEKTKRRIIIVTNVGIMSYPLMI
jgi:hypothetical protein